MRILRIGKTIKIIGKVILWIVGIWAGLLLLVQIILCPPILSRIIDSLADEYLEADLTFSKASVSVLRHFPRVTLNLEDAEITYPHDRFDSLEQQSVQNALLYHGCGETADTLAAIHRLSVSVSLSALLTGDLKFPDIEIDSPRIYAHYYDAENANWNIFGSSDESEETQAVDTTSTQAADDSEGMNIIFSRISITGNPVIVYTDSQDSLFTDIRMKSLTFDGNFETNDLHQTTADAGIDDFFMRGRYGADTLAARLGRFDITRSDEHMHMHIKADAFMTDDEEDINAIPIDFSSDFTFPEDPGLAIALNNIKANIATIPASGHFSIALREDRTMMDGKIDIDRCKIQVLLHGYLAEYMPELLGITTDTEVSATAIVSGHMHDTDGTMPAVDVTMDIPDSRVDYKTFPEKITFGMKASFQMDTTGRMQADVTRAKLHTYGLDINAAVGLYDITGEDPDVRIDGNIKASLDSLRSFLPDTLNLTAQGDLSGKLKGTAKLSHIGIYEFSKSDLTGNLKGEGIRVQMPDDSIDLRLDGLDIKLGPENITSKKEPGKSFRLMGITGSLAMADITYTDAFSFKGSKVEFSAKNSTDQTPADRKSINYLGGRLNAELLQLNDSEGTSIKLEKTKNSFQMRPKPGQPTIPILSLANQNLRITYVTEDNRVILTDSKIDAEAHLNTLDRSRRRAVALDSLAKVYPDIPRDSLFRFVRSQRSAKAIPSWMEEEDFKSSDIRFDLNETAKKYFREWEFSGHAGIRTGIIMTPYFPLRNILRGAALSITNNSISVDSLKVMAGESEIRAEGAINGLRRAMLRGGNLDMNLKLSSNSVNADELLKAYNLGARYEAPESETSSEMTNAEFFKQVTTDTVQTTHGASSLIVIPGNINAKIDIDASGIRYKDLSISSFISDITVRERCAQLTGTSMRSNIGGFDLDAFYATRSKKDIRTGFCLDFKDITSERVTGMIPEIDDIMPMIGSIHGKLNCEVAVTASLDTTMSIMMPTVNGIGRITGKDLSISDDEFFTSIAKTLMFKNKKKGEVDNLQVEVAIKDNQLEVFPFLLELDRYTLAISGVQNMDMSYKHHISVLRSPLLIRLGLNLSGPDYDHMKFKVGKALYRSKKMPSFTAVIDQTKNDLRYSIYNIFDTGVDKTIDNDDMQSLIGKHQSAIGYINAAEMEMEELSKEELEKLEESEAADAAYENLMSAATAAIQEVLKKY